ncbi:outer membrane protein transport protein [Labilibaculum sp. K2S]|uniref:OmpP1/FadL family transporter n=1 Tax=Labilibaculum sp. K2S TaxID=3056386 RepID=UPI0025A3341E|nr:outer membrane protein transport protein [Labilibaculum sp. K2S]MDM8161370.1 outer membrane protein transport protein [Labilibaculum sp. K2S]
MIRKICLAVVIIVMAINVKAEGYAVNVQGNKQTGMGHVGTALNFDASSMQWNPGALATLDQKYSFSVGGFATIIKTEFTGALSKEKTDNPTGTPFYLYGSMKVNEKLAIGLGVYTPFGNKVDWGKSWSGKYLIQDIELKAIYIQPTVSYQLADWISVGAGLNIVYGEFSLNKAFPIRNPADGSYIADGAVELSGSKIKYGYNLGVFLQPTGKLNIGLSYRSQVDIDLDYADGEADFTIPEALPAQIKGVFPDGGLAATLPLPASFNVGLAYQIDEKWLVSADVNFVQWNKYKSLDFNFENDPASVLDSKSTRNWNNSMTYRIGAQYSANEKLDIRAGFYYDETPTNKKFYTPETPGANKIGISAGFSYMLTDKLSVDASLLYIEGEKTTGTDPSGNFTGAYKNTGFLPGIGITYNL